MNKRAEVCCIKFDPRFCKTVQSPYNYLLLINRIAPTTDWIYRYLIFFIWCFFSSTIGSLETLWHLITIKYMSMHVFTWNLDLKMRLNCKGKQQQQSHLPLDVFKLLGRSDFWFLLCIWQLLYLWLVQKLQPRAEERCVHFLVYVSFSYAAICICQRKSNLGGFKQAQETLPSLQAFLLASNVPTE